MQSEPILIGETIICTKFLHILIEFCISLVEKIFLLVDGLERIEIPKIPIDNEQ